MMIIAEVMITQFVIPGDKQMLMRLFGMEYGIYGETPARLLASLS